MKSANAPEAHMVRHNPDAVTDQAEGTLFEDYDPAAADSVELATDDGTQIFDDAYRNQDIPKPAIEPQLSPHQNLYERTNSELEISKLVADNEEKTGWIKKLEKEWADGKTDEEQSNKLRAARDRIRANNEALRLHYGFDSLVAAGFDEADVEIEFNQMMSEYRAKFMGKENKSKRESRRRHLDRQLALGAQAIDPWQQPTRRATTHPVVPPVEQPEPKLSLMPDAKEPGSVPEQAHAMLVELKRRSIDEDTSLTPAQKAVKHRVLTEKESQRHKDIQAS